MPLYFDLHPVPGITPEMVGHASHEQGKIEGEYGVETLAWFCGGESGKAF